MPESVITYATDFVPAVLPIQFDYENFHSQHANIKNPIEIISAAEPGRKTDPSFNPAVPQSVWQEQMSMNSSDLSFSPNNVTPIDSQPRHQRGTDNNVVEEHSPGTSCSSTPLTLAPE